MVLPEWTVKVIKNSLHLLLEMSKHFILKKLLMPLKDISKKRILFEHPVAPNGIPFGSKFIRKAQLQSQFGII